MLPIADLFGWSGEGNGLPLVADALEVALVALGVATALLAIRFVALRIRARTPRVQVSSVTQTKGETGNEGGDGDGERDQDDTRPDDIAWIGALLKEQLSALRLDPMDALPEASSGSTLVEIVEGVGEGIGDKSQLARALGRLFRAMVPEAAYEVSAGVRVSGKKKTISLQVVDRTHRSGAFVDIVESDGDWAKCAEEAAATVAGALYPSIADRYTGPWTHWRAPVPRELVMLHARARRYEAEDRLEQAMGAYHDALDQDPLNPNLRLRIAMLQERLGLNLGAWVTYRAIADETNRDAWKGPDRRVRLLALYRIAILLGSEGVATSWMSTDCDPAENEHREELRASLVADRMFSGTSWLERVNRSLARGRIPAALTASRARRLLMELHRKDRNGDDQADEAPRDLEEWIAGRLPEPAEGEKTPGGERADPSLAELLQIVSLFRLEQLDARLRRKPPWRIWRVRKWWRYRPAARHVLSRREFSLSAVRVSKLIAQLRIIASAERRDDIRTPRRAGLPKRERLLRRWPFRPSAARQPVRWLRPRHRLADRRNDAWQYHYNAACAVSIALELDMWVGDRKTDEQMQQGIKQLEEYAHRAGSTQVRAQTDWVAHEDDDLKKLRGTLAYERWISHHMPGRKVERVSGGARQVDTGRIAARIAYGCACAFSHVWRARANEAHVDAGKAIRWWDQEVIAWMTVATVVEEHRSWHARWAAIDTLQACLSGGGSDVPMDVAHRPTDRKVGIGSTTTILSALEEITDEIRPDGEYRSIGQWARCQAGRATAAHKEATARRNGRSGSRIDRDEALRAYWIWTYLAESLDEALDGDTRAPGLRMLKCRAEVASELKAKRPRHTARWPNFSRMRP